MILVVGATGSLGSRIVHELLESDQTVRALARPSSEHAALGSAGAEVVIGDLKDPATLERACEGIGVVITTASASKRGPDSIEDVDLHGNQSLIAAAEQAGVGQFVLISTVAASAQSPVPVFRAKAAAEKRLRENAMVHTILQATGYMDVWFPMLIEMPVASAQTVTLVGESRRRHSFVAERDVAAFALAALRHPDARNATIAIGGPAAITFQEVVRAYEEAAGRPIPVRSVAPGEPIPGLPEPVWGIAASLETFDTIVPMEETAERFGIALTSARAFARSRLGAVAQ